MKNNMSVYFFMVFFCQPLGASMVANSFSVTCLMKVGKIKHIFNIYTREKFYFKVNGTAAF